MSNRLSIKIDFSIHDKKWKSYPLRQKLNQTSTLAWKVKVASVFFIWPHFPNNCCLHNDTMGIDTCSWRLVCSRESLHCYMETCNKDTILYFRNEKREIPAQYVPCNVLQVVTLKFFIPRTQFRNTTNIYVCQIDMNIPNLFMEPHEIITSHLWPSEKYFIWIKIIQRTHQP